MPSDISVVTTTFYNQSPGDLLRRSLTKKTIENCINQGYKIIVADRSENDDIKKEFQKIGARVLVQEKGMGKSRRQVIKAAYETRSKIIVWIEPEKYSLIEELEKTFLPIKNGNAELVIPKRKSLVSYPLFQQYCENFANIFFKDLTGFDLDVEFGPRIFQRDISSYFLEYDGNKEGYGDLWDSIFVPVLNIIADKKRVESVDVDFEYPKEQKEFEEKNSHQFYLHRMNQLTNIFYALEDRWKKLNQK